MNSKDSPWFIRRAPRDRASLRLFLFPHAGAGSVIFHDWHADFPASIDVCAVEPPGRLVRRKERPFSDVFEFAKAFDRAVEPFLDLPFAFFGYSLGTLMAFECARLLRSRRKLTPSQLIVAAHRAPHLPSRRTQISREPRQTFVAELERRYGPFDPMLKSDPEMFDAVVDIMRVDLGMVESYKFSPEAPLNCPILAIGGTEDAGVPQSDLDGWREHTSSEFRSKSLPGGHFFLRNRGAELRALVRDQVLANTTAKAPDRH